MAESGQLQTILPVESHPVAAVTARDSVKPEVERAWFRAAPQPARPYASAEFNPLDDKVAIKTHCPKCEASDWFEWKFLGKLTDPICGHTWYADSGTYTVQQMRAVEMSRRTVKYMNHGISGEGAWIAKILGGFLGMVLGMAFRLPFAVMMIPIQAVVRLSGTKAESAK